MQCLLAYCPLRSTVIIISQDTLHAASTCLLHATSTCLLFFTVNRNNKLPRHIPCSVYFPTVLSASATSQLPKLAEDCLFLSGASKEGKRELAVTRPAVAVVVAVAVVFPSWTLWGSPSIHASVQWQQHSYWVRGLGVWRFYLMPCNMGGRTLSSEDLSPGWTLLSKELLMVSNSLHTTMQHTPPFRNTSALVFSLVSTLLWHNPSRDATPF